ncbi:F-box protein At3g28330-like [Papaver somniferum]|uniref:F-box protein At3g28330-like n=1 Tax=Papaver somniferum TaxID=3469 RepID=UPI000E6FB23B|nr:F-box protein At3g28330-like [Papaver somniferum]
MPNSCYYPEDVFLEIFVRLPFKSICKFRCGGSSTLWTLISRYWFKSSEYKFDGAVDKMSFVSTSSTQLHHEIISSKDEFSCNFPLDSSMLNKQEERCTYLLASSNGLVLCSSNEYGPRYYFICNPFTRQCVSLLPRSVYGCAGITGFVFESSTGTYKVIHIPYCYKYGNLNLNIFSSDTSEWSTREVTCSDHQAELHIHSCLQIVHHSGTWYWVDGGGNYIIAYNDYHNNGSECRLLNLPEGVVGLVFRNTALGNQKGFFAMDKLRMHGKEALSLLIYFYLFISYIIK